MRKGFTYIPVIVMVGAVVVFGVVGYLAFQSTRQSENQNDRVPYDTPPECITDADCAFAASCAPTTKASYEESGEPYIERICPGRVVCFAGKCMVDKSLSNSNSSAANTNIFTNTNTQGSTNTNSAINENTNISSNQNTNTSTPTPPKARLISASAKDGYITLKWETDLPTHNTIQFREVGGMKVAMNEDGDTNTHDPYNHSVVIPNIRSGKTIEYEFRSCADVLKWRTCRASCGGAESCIRGCTLSTLNNCVVGESHTIGMPEY